MHYSSVEPLPADLVTRPIVFDSIGTVILGIVVAALNK